MSGSDRVNMWDIETQTLLYTSSIDSAAFSITQLDCGQIVIGCENGDLQIWNSTYARNPKKVCAHTSLISCCIQLHDGLIASSGFFDKTVKLWDIRAF